MVRDEAIDRATGQLMQGLRGFEKEFRLYPKSNGFWLI
jgi:hypothetical protein